LRAKSRNTQKKEKVDMKTLNTALAIIAATASIVIAAEPAPAPAAPPFPPPGAQPMPGPAMSPMPAGPAAGGLPPGAMEEFMKMAMETSAKIEAIKKRIAEREEELYGTHPQIKELHASLVEMQNRINAIIQSDAEFAAMKMKHDIKATITPDFPKTSMPMRAPGQMPMMQSGQMPMMPPGQMPMMPPGQMPMRPPKAPVQPPAPQPAK